MGCKEFAFFDVVLMGRHFTMITSGLVPRIVLEPHICTEGVFSGQLSHDCVRSLVRGVVVRIVDSLLR